MWGRVCAIGLLAATLTGCEGMNLGLAPDGAGQGMRSLRMLDGAVQVRGPQGYCVDQRASRARDGFAVLAGCAIVSDHAAEMPVIDGLLTVQFGAENTASVAGNEAGFASFIASDAGRALLASNGNAANVGRVVTTVGRGSVIARFEDRSGPVVAGTAGTQWRGFMDIGDRMVTVSVMGFARKPMTQAQAERLLVGAMAELRQVNGAAVAGGAAGAAGTGAGDRA